MVDREPSPYTTHAAELANGLSDPRINAKEHTIFWPRILEYLPSEPEAAQNILDYGCGPGNFTFDLARRYPDATILGTDASAEILPASSQHNVHFQQWDGLAPLEASPDIAPGGFNIVLSKMVLHYVRAGDLGAVAAHLCQLRAPDCRLIFSVPHPNDTLKYLGARPEHMPFTYTRNIGKIGIAAAMTYRASGMLILPFLRHLPEDYVTLISDIDAEQPFRRSHAWANLVPFARMAATHVRRYRGGEGKGKRAIVAFLPHNQVASVLERQGHPNPEEGAEIAACITQLLRTDSVSATNSE